MKCPICDRWIEPGEKTTHVEKRVPPWKESGGGGYIVHRTCMDREKEQQQKSGNRRRRRTDETTHSGTKKNAPTALRAGEREGPDGLREVFRALVTLDMVHHGV